MNRKRKLMAVIVVLVCITLITLTPVFATRSSGSTILFTTTQSRQGSYDIIQNPYGAVMEASFSYSNNLNNKITGTARGLAGSRQSVSVGVQICPSRGTPNQLTWETRRNVVSASKTRWFAKNSDCTSVSRDNTFNSIMTFQGLGY
jgi:type II secretory pathway component PulK